MEECSYEVIKVGTVFGELKSINYKKWRGGVVFALEPSTVIVFSLPAIKKIIKVFFKAKR